jgi:hypothetical protein
MAIDYRQMLGQLLEEHASWMRRRDEAARELSKVAGLIRATVKMLPPQQAALGERVLEELDERPLGLTEGIRLSLMTDTREWMSPTEIRESLRGLGFSFESYKANPLASIHTTLKRLGDEVEVKGPAGGKVYRLKGTRLDSAPSLVTLLKGQKVRALAPSARQLLAGDTRARRKGDKDDGSTRES